MEVKFETHQVALPANARDSLIARVKRSMGRMSDKVQRLHIQLKETSDTKSPKVKVCTIQAQLVGGGAVVVVDKSSNAAKALFRGSRRCRALVSRKIRRSRQFRSTPKSQLALASTTADNPSTPTPAFERAKRKLGIATESPAFV